MKKISLIMAVILLATVSLIADNHMSGVHEGMRAERGGRTEMSRHNGSRDGGMMFMYLAEELELSDKVKAEIDELQTANKKAAIKLRADLEILRIDKRQAMQERDFSEVKKLNTALSEKRLELTNSRVDTHESIWNKLSKSQQAKVMELMQDCDGNRRNHQKIKPKRM